MTPRLSRRNLPYSDQPAFPARDEQTRGMTIREYIATQIMAGITDGTEDAVSLPYTAQTAVQAADALLAALAVKSPNNQ